MEHVDTAVIGAGVVGLASAVALARTGRRVCVLERSPKPGMGTSTRNSQVIHAGIYYPAGSLKARLAVEGAKRLYAFCAEHNVPHARCGKLIVAPPSGDSSALEQLLARGRANGADGLTLPGPAVSTSTPSSVTSTVCSNCAVRLPSAVTAVQPSSQSLCCQVPSVIIGSMVKVMPGRITVVEVGE